MEKPALAVTASPAARRTATHRAPIVPTEVTKDETRSPALPPATPEAADGPVGPATPGPATPVPTWASEAGTPSGAVGGTGARQPPRSHLLT
ncbi:MAG: hypothetical protein WKG07_11295 [Hymenobacter sp.]